MANTQLQDTLEKMMKTFPNKKKLWGGRNYCEVSPLEKGRFDGSGGERVKGSVGGLAPLKRGVGVKDDGFAGGPPRIGWGPPGQL